MSLNYRIIGQRLKKARLAKNLTQQTLSEQIEVSVSFLSNIERGKSHINLKRLNQICTILEVSEGSILNGTSNSSNTYLNNEFSDLLFNCSNDKRELAYKILKIISEN